MHPRTAWLSAFVGMVLFASTTEAGYLWVPNFDDDTVSKVNTITNTVVATIPVGPGPAGIAVGNQYIYVTHSRSSRVYRIGKTSNTVVDSIDVSSEMGGPVGVALDCMGNAYVVGRINEPGCSTRSPAKLVKLNPDGTIQASVSLPQISCTYHSSVPNCDLPEEHAMETIGIGITSAGYAVIPYQESYDGNTGINVVRLSDLSKTTYTFSHAGHGYHAPGVAIDIDGTAWVSSHRASVRKLVHVDPGTGVTVLALPCYPSNFTCDFELGGGHCISHPLDASRASWHSVF